MELLLTPGGVTAACGLPPAAAGVVIIFAALPTAQSCYVMTAAMHGNAPAVAAAASLQTLAAIVTLPICQAIKKSRFRGSKILPTNNVCRQGKRNCS